MNKNLVYAGTREECKIWAWQNRIYNHNVIFVNDIINLKGLARGTKIVLVGTYQTRDDYLQFKQEAILRGFNLIEEDETDESNYTPSRPIQNISRRIRSEES